MCCCVAGGKPCGQNGVFEQHSPHQHLHSTEKASHGYLHHPGDTHGGDRKHFKTSAAESSFCRVQR